MEYIETRLAELEEEREELEEYLNLDRERRCLEYNIYSREQDEAIQDLEELEDLRRDGMDQAQSRLQAYSDQEVTIQVRFFVLA